LEFAVDRWLTYGKVGGGWAQDSAAFTFPSGAPIWTDTNTRGGWLLGGGIEYGFKPNWTVKLEYDYLKLGDWTAPTVPAEWRRDVQMIKMGMNYKFESGNLDDATRTPDDSTGSARAKGRQPATEDVGDLPLRLFVRGCARASAARPLVCPCLPPTVPRRVISLGLLQPGIEATHGRCHTQADCNDEADGKQREPHLASSEP
jgi:OmpA-like transmembrane domain